jgi:CRISPR-associated protein Cmr1
MQEITFNCKVVSPMFIGNASTNACELRPSAIKASMRFWWRALHPNFSPERLRIEECKLFGGSYIPRNNNEKTKNHPPKFRFLAFTTELKTTREKLDSRNNKTIKKEAILPETTFTITLLCKEPDTQTIIALVYLASALGGLGNRSRRGTGVWKITSYKTKLPKNDPELTYTIDSVLQTIQYLNKDSYTINNGTIVLIPGKINPTANNSGFPYVKEVCIGTAYKNQSTLRTRIMEIAHELKDEDSNIFSKSLGSATRRRLASPVIASIIANPGSQIIRPIVSTVHHKYQIRDKEAIVDFQNRFKNAILYNEAVG